MNMESLIMNGYPCLINSEERKSIWMPRVLRILTIIVINFLSKKGQRLICNVIFLCIDAVEEAGQRNWMCLEDAFFIKAMSM